MYTVVLMAALTTPNTAPNHWFRSHGCHGCHGCSGCYGCSGCNGCSGCYGCSGCNGYVGCHGYGTCQGAYSCYGCYGCYGGGGFCAGGPNVHGGCYGCFGCQGCYGCYGGYACYGTALPGHGYIQDVPMGTVETRPVPKAEQTPLPKEKIIPKAKVPGDEEVRVPNKARVIVQLPADAKLFIDDQPMKTASDRRVFQTPNLNPGQVYFYDIRAEIEVNGQRVSETQRVILHPGEVANATFPNLMNAATGSTAPASARRAR